jgi:hypothetical protein
MALPILGAVAQFLASNGARAAAVKFGKKAVDAAKKEINKRDSAIMEKADRANTGIKKTPSPQSIRRGQDTSRNKRVAKEERARAPRPPREEMPLKFKKGGKVRGAGIARKGVRPAKMR